MTAPAKGSLQLRLHAAATPGRVAIAATMFDNLLRTAYPHLPQNSVTMVVSNYDMTAGMRFQSAAGQRAIEGAIRFFSEPIKETKKRPAWRAAAIAMYEPLQELYPYGVELRTPRRVIRHVDETFIETIHHIARTKRPLVLRGETFVYSPIYRIGRTSENKSVRARIAVDGARHEIKVKEGAETMFYDAAKEGGVRVVRLDAAWYRNESGDLELDKDQSVAISLEPWQAATGADFMQQVRCSPVPLFEDIEDIVKDLEGL